MTRITKDPAERRQEILDTAMKLFYEKGYEKTSISDIARELHIAQGLCYRYFPSKEALFDCAIDQYAQQLADRMKPPASREAPRTLKQIIMEAPTFLEAEKDDGFCYKICHGEEGRKMHDQLSMRVCAKLVPAVRELLERANANGETRLPDIDSAASFCVYGQMGILLRDDLAPEEKVRRVRSFLCYILGL